VRNSGSLSSGMPSSTIDQKMETSVLLSRSLAWGKFIPTIVDATTCQGLKSLPDFPKSSSAGGGRDSSSGEEGGGEDMSEDTELHRGRFLLVVDIFAWDYLVEEFYT
jgi:hypothetical protein